MEGVRDERGCKEEGEKEEEEEKEEEKEEVGGGQKAEQEAGKSGLVGWNAQEGR